MSATHACFDASIPRTVPSATTLEAGRNARNITTSQPGAEPEPDEFRLRVYRFVKGNAGRLLVRTRELAAARPVPRATTTELGEGIAELLEALLGELASGPSPSGAPPDRRPRAPASPSLDVTRVVLDYIDARTAIVELAAEPNIWIGRRERDALDRCVAEAAARAAGEYARRREEYVASNASARFACLAHELRDRLSVAVVAYALLEAEGKVRGRAAEVLERSIAAMAERVERELAEVRRHGRAAAPARVASTELVEELDRVAAAKAKARDLEWKVEIEGDDLEVEADRVVVGDAVSNAVKGALEATRVPGAVRLTVGATSDRVVVEVAEERGDPRGALVHGTSVEKVADAGSDRSGLDLDSSTVRRAAEASGGRLVVRALPDGCVLAIELPRRVDGPR